MVFTNKECDEDRNEMKIMIKMKDDIWPLIWKKSGLNVFREATTQVYMAQSGGYLGKGCLIRNFLHLKLTLGNRGDSTL